MHEYCEKKGAYEAARRERIRQHLNGLVSSERDIAHAAMHDEGTCLIHQGRASPERYIAGLHHLLDAQAGPVLALDAHGRIDREEQGGQVGDVKEAGTLLVQLLPHFNEVLSDEVGRQGT